MTRCLFIYFKKIFQTYFLVLDDLARTAKQWQQQH